jgi:hypothetical protein
MLALLPRGAQYISVPTSDRGRRLVEAAALVAVVALVYARALPGPFVFDDRASIVENESLRSLWPLGAVLAQPAELTTSGRPIVALSFAVDHALYGLDARGFRITSGAIHAVCAILLAAVVRRTLRSPRLAERFAAHAEPIAFSAALLFAVHPLASEVACYASARTESLMAAFFLATLYAAIHARTSERPWGWIALAIGCCALGMASKEVMATAPVVIALYDVVFLRAPDAGERRVRTVLWTGLAATWAVLLVLVLGQPRSESAGFALWVTPLVYLANQCRVLPEYLRLVLWPSPLRLDYGLPEPLALGDVWAGAAFLVALALLSFYALWRWPAAGFVGVICFAILAPSSSVVPIVSEVGAERRMYLPLAALVTLAVSVGWLGLSHVARARRAPWLVGIVALALAGVSASRAGDYADEIALWRADVRAAPENARPRYNLSRALRRAGREDEARVEHLATVRREIAFYQRILPFQPDRVQALGDLATLHVIAGELARADELYAQVLELAPTDPTALRMRERLRARLSPP